MKTCIRIFLVIGLACILFSCQPRRLVVGQFVSVLEAGVPAFEKETDIDLLAQSYPTQIKLLEALLVSDSENLKLRILLSRLYAGYAFSDVETRLEALRYPPPNSTERKQEAETTEAAARLYYQRGASYALSAISLKYPEGEKKLGRISEAQSFLDGMEKGDVPLLFWYGFNLAAWINLSRNDMAAVAKAHLVEKVMKRVIALDEEYYNGSAHLVLLNYYASRPPMMGGRPDAARAHYKKIKELNGDAYFLADVFFARTLLVQMQDRPSFEEMLGRVVKQAPAETPCPMLNQIAVMRARIYLGAAQHLFH